MLENYIPAYALVHVKYTLPPALALSALYAPLASKTDVYKIIFLLAVCFAATTPWDAYLIKRGIWSYPSDAILGPAPLGIPLEEYAFFFIQTWTTSLLYLVLSKPVFQPGYLATPSDKWAGILPYRWIGRAGQLALAITFLAAALAVTVTGPGLYLGLILVWATPVLFLLWSLSYTHLLSLPLKATFFPVLLPTVYLWLVDTTALHRGTWVIASGTKTGLFLWPHLEIEEATFFLLSNVLLVWGHIAFDHALTILHSFPHLFPSITELPSPVLLLRALFTPESRYDRPRMDGIRAATRVLFSKSRSFSLASAAFSGRLRIDLVLLYAFCRAADDLIDEAPTPVVANHALGALTQLLDMYYAPGAHTPRAADARRAFVHETFPRAAHAPLLLLPAHAIPRTPLDDLLAGFRTDIAGFGAEKGMGRMLAADVPPPIESEADLLQYAHCVAGTIGALCVALVRHHAAEPEEAADDKHWATLARDADAMGCALQLVNIARDVWTDARLPPRGRVYLPRAWLAKEGTDASELVRAVHARTGGAAAMAAIDVEACYARARAERAVGGCRARLLRTAGTLHADALPAIEMLPRRWGARGGVRCAVESYMAIGNAVWSRAEDGVDGGAESTRPSVPIHRRLWIAYRALAQG